MMDNCAAGGRLLSAPSLAARHAATSIVHCKQPESLEERALPWQLLHLGRVLAGASPSAACLATRYQQPWRRLELHQTNQSERRRLAAHRLDE